MNIQPYFMSGLWVIARRDYLASVRSKAFLLFLLAPLLPFLLGQLFDTDGSSLDEGLAKPTITLSGGATENQLWAEARRRLVVRYGETGLPILSANFGSPKQLTLSGSIDYPVISGPDDFDRQIPIGLAALVNEAKFLRDSAVDDHTSPATALRVNDQHHDIRKSETAQIGQLGILILTLLLSGMMLSGLVEERSTKTLDVLAAALPIQVIFYGKLMAVLLLALTGTGVWILGALAYATPILASLGVAEPATGWPVFASLGLLYALSAVLLFGAIYLAVGAYASTNRELQSVAMPLTVFQILCFALAMNGHMTNQHSIQYAAAIIPWSSPFYMLGKAATQQSLLPHVLAIAWQIASALLIVKVSALAFRASVLNGRPFAFIKTLGCYRKT